MIIVRNTSSDDVTARYAGQEYKFPAGKDTPCEDDVARHVFGYGGDGPAKDAALLRLGWVLPGQTKDAALARLDQIVFKTATVRIEADEPQAKQRSAA